VIHTLRNETWDAAPDFCRFSGSDFAGGERQPGGITQPTESMQFLSGRSNPVATLAVQLLRFSNKVGTALFTQSS
jgi:hypothetical protein